MKTKEMRMKLQHLFKSVEEQQKKKHQHAARRNWVAFDETVYRTVLTSIAAKQNRIESFARQLKIMKIFVKAQENSIEVLVVEWMRRDAKQENI